MSRQSQPKNVFISLALVASVWAVSPAAQAETEVITVDGATLRGNQEQPQVLYIVPWRKPRKLAGLGDSAASLINDEVLKPIDREEFVRQVDYYELFKDDASAPSETPK
ncbi:conserved hypothetical protein [Hahella chejuensis KCTC 2396]|uniref:Uncharacterized protein n=1 Tax=Hahella chejuensis (strain KCTC 2396) TaxID=349521 RepID=Q2SIX8_HAHCH|nr:hypothetical protein [Hahella chejuensis]ABC29396.1 conserved hypothetical protein [Hahella chejuensis KCTC 2396]